MSRDAVIAVMDYWNSMSYDAVLDIGDTVYYDWTDYIDEVEAAKVNNTVLTFEAYKEDGEEYLNRPYAVKEVLEDGLFGRYPVQQ